MAVVKVFWICDWCESHNVNRVKVKNQYEGYDTAYSTNCDNCKMPHILELSMKTYWGDMLDYKEAKEEEESLCSDDEGEE